MLPLRFVLPASLPIALPLAPAQEADKPSGPTPATDAAGRQELFKFQQKAANLVDVDLKALEQALDAVGAPWTPGRLPVR